MDAIKVWTRANQAGLSATYVWTGGAKTLPREQLQWLELAAHNSLVAGLSPAGPTIRQHFCGDTLRTTLFPLLERLDFALRTTRSQIILKELANFVSVFSPVLELEKSEGGYSAFSRGLQIPARTQRPPEEL
ncbi:hypothetical protein [Bradyrhizobium shewense]|uniref:hypothetical protein n=1 Tax=Bradyrhizobium shewense TaxID=1761772 RepID=UPI00101ADF87|nr:hypothetical protein [Bradyrhizobium shewense]